MVPAVVRVSLSEGQCHRMETFDPPVEQRLECCLAFPSVNSTKAMNGFMNLCDINGNDPGVPFLLLGLPATSSRDCPVLTGEARRESLSLASAGVAVAGSVRKQDQLRLCLDTNLSSLNDLGYAAYPR